MERPVGRDSSVRLLVALANMVLGLALLVALVWAGLKIVHALLVFALGILVAYALAPLVAWLRRGARNRLSQGAGVFLVLLVLVSLGALLVLAASGPTGRQIRELEAQAPALRARADALAAGADQWLARHHIDFRIASIGQRMTQLAHEQGQALAREALHDAGRLVAGLVDLLLIFLVSVYFLIYASELKRRFAKHIPPLYEHHFQGLGRDMNQILGGFIRGQLILAATMGLAAGIGCGLLRLPFWILIGLFVALMSLIPIIGAYLGAIPAIALAMLDPAHPAAKVAWVVALFFVVNEAGSKILYPRLVGSATGLHEVLVLFVLIAGAEVGGIVGALLAVPFTALFGLLAVYAYRIWQQGEHPATPEPAPPVVGLPDERAAPASPLAAADRRTTAPDRS